MTENLTFITKTGVQTETIFDDLAKLRIAVFHDYPYLYEGTIDYEKEYLKIYAASAKSFVFAVYNGGLMVGATTCIPLADETADVRKPFEDGGFDLDSIFYFGESILLPEFRGLGLGHRFFDEREAHAGSFGTFGSTCFCSVLRDENHPARPAGYRPNDAFWLKRGYHREPSLRSTFEWPDIGDQVSTPKTMEYWIKEIKQDPAGSQAITA